MMQSKRIMQSHFLSSGLDAKRYFSKQIPIKINYKLLNPNGEVIAG